MHSIAPRDSRIGHPGCTAGLGLSREKRVICVGQVIGSFSGGGAQRLAYNLALGLAEMGMRSVAIAVRSAGSYAQSPPENVRVVELHADRAGPTGLAAGAMLLRRLVRQEQIDLLHVHGAPSLPFVVLATRCMRGRPRIAFTWQDSESVLRQRGWRRKLMIWALRQCDSVSGSSRIVAGKLRDAAGLQAVGIFHGGVPVSRRRDGNWGEPVIILWLGRLVPPKDPQSLIRAAARLNSEGLRFKVHVIGRPIASTLWYQEQTRALIKELGLVDVVYAPGYMPDDELAELMRSASIGVQTSHTEGLSIALLEQMMMGLAIVATDVGDTSAALEDGASGILIPPRDEDCLTAALRRLLIDPDLRDRLGRAARKRALEHYSWQRMAERAAEEYLQIVTSK